MTFSKPRGRAQINIDKIRGSNCSANEVRTVELSPRETSTNGARANEMSAREVRTATSTVNADCMGVIKGTNGNDSANFVIVDGGGKEVEGIDTSSVTSAIFTLKKQFPAGDLTYPALGIRTDRSGGMIL